MNKSIVLMFHEIHDEKWFDDTLNHLSRKYRFVSATDLNEVVLGTRISNGICHITFDDGHVSFYNKAYPILKKHGFPATLFISPEKIIRRENYWFQRVRSFSKAEFHHYVCSQIQDKFDVELGKYGVYSILKSMPISVINNFIEGFRNIKNLPEEEFINIDVDQLLEIADSGLIEIGAHTMNHPILANEDDSTARFEITKSISDLQSLIKRDVRYFAYPNGQPVLDFGAREENFLKESGIRLAFSTSSDQLKPAYSLFALPRIGISKGSIGYVNRKIRFAKHWIGLRNLMHRTTEDKERKILSQNRRNL